VQIDFSKGVAIHRLYGHYTFTVEASKAGKDNRFAKHICSYLNCKGTSTTWRTDLIDKL
jgi:hypothetical protein